MNKEGVLDLSALSDDELLTLVASKQEEEIQKFTQISQVPYREYQKIIKESRRCNDYDQIMQMSLGDRFLYREKKKGLNREWCVCGVRGKYYFLREKGSNIVTKVPMSRVHHLHLKYMNEDVQMYEIWPRPLRCFFRTSEMVVQRRRWPTWEEIEEEGGFRTSYYIGDITSGYYGREWNKPFYREVIDFYEAHPAYNVRYDGQIVQIHSRDESNGKDLSCREDGSEWSIAGQGRILLTMDCNYVQVHAFDISYLPIEHQRVWRDNEVLPEEFHGYRNMNYMGLDTACSFEVEDQATIYDILQYDIRGCRVFKDDSTTRGLFEAMKCVSTGTREGFYSLMQHLNEIFIEGVDREYIGLRVQLRKKKEESKVGEIMCIKAWLRSHLCLGYDSTLKQIPNELNAEIDKACEVLRTIYAHRVSGCHRRHKAYIGRANKTRQENIREAFDICDKLRNLIYFIIKAEIRGKAYEIYLKRQEEGKLGTPLDDWLQAKRELGYHRTWPRI